jgi:hypothetical protein
VNGGPIVTVISTLITRRWTVHASDSFITELQPDGKRKIIESERSKIVKVGKWSGIVSYFGLATYEKYKWDTYEWLREKVKTTTEYTTAEEFAIALKEELSSKMGSMRFDRPVDARIGLHFTAYEHIGGYWIPEMYFITNSTNPPKLGLGRETYHTVVNVAADMKHSEERCRLTVHDYLHSEPNMLIYNNGDPEMFNAAADSIHRAFSMIKKRGTLKETNNLKTFLDLARRPVDLVSEAQLAFVEKDHRTIGGKSHDLGVDSGGNYESTTGDN